MRNQVFSWGRGAAAAVASFVFLPAIAEVCHPLPVAPVTISASPGDALEDVRDKIRALSPQERLRGVEVVLHGGLYSLSKPLELGCQDGCVCWRAADGETPVIVGSTGLTVADFIPWAKNEKVLVADLSDRPIGYWKDPQKEFELPLDVPELFVDGSRMTVARWPNGDDWAVIDEVLDHGTYRKGMKLTDDKVRGGVFLTKERRPLAWRSAKAVWLQGYWCYDWYDSVIPASRISEEKDKTKIELRFYHVFGIGVPNAAVKAPRRWRALNLLEELDAPGEYFLDREAKKLYFMPPKPMTAQTEIALTFGDGNLVSVTGAKDIVFRGLSFREGYKTGLVVTGCRGVRIEDCRFRNFRERAADFSDCWNCRISYCEVLDTGAGGVRLYGGDRRTLERGENIIEHCVIRRFSSLRPVYTPGIDLGGCGNTARYCEVTDTPHMALTAKGNDMLFDHCVVSNAVTNSDDAGAFYKGRNPSMTGNVIRDCLFSDIGTVRSHGTAAIYFDDGDSGERVENCTFRRVVTPTHDRFGAVFCNGGWSNVVVGCTFENCSRPLGYCKWYGQGWTDFVQMKTWPYVRKWVKEDVDIESTHYQERYPVLRDFFGGQPDEVRCNVGKDCIFIDCDEAPRGAWKLENCVLNHK